MQYRSVADLNTQIINNLYKIPRETQLIVGVPRSGTLAGNLIALHLNIPFIDLQGYLLNLTPTGGDRVKDLLRPISAYEHILVVDDSLLTGKEMKKTKNAIEQANSKAHFTYLAVFIVPDAIDQVDIFMDVCEYPRVFEWNVMHHSILDLCLMDIDGVLCSDPTDLQNDDGQEYLDFLKNARPLFRPSQKIGCIITNRLEKYRKETEEWLKNYNIRYDYLIMLNLPDMATRKNLGKHAEFKAMYYQKSNALLFIESSDFQAKKIAELTKRPVYCTDTKTLINLK